jgi:hypothetical protein
MDKQNKLDIDRDNKLYFLEDGDAGFSPERNKQVIASSIKKYEAMRAKKNKEYTESIRERADAVATYLKSRVAEGNTSIEKYYGKQELTRLQGVSIMNKLKRNLLGQQKNIYIPS